jgi:hypothetical protein
MMNPRKIFALLLLSMAIVTCFAQEGESKSKFQQFFEGLDSQDEIASHTIFHGGIRLGFTASQISGDRLSGFHKFGAYSGLYVNFPLRKDRKWKMQLEINFMMKGSHSYTAPGSSAPINPYSLTMLYTETPLLVKWYPYKGIELEMGPAINFLCFSKEKELYEIHAIDKFRIYEVAIVIGVGYMFAKHYGVNLRWSSSLVPVRKCTTRRAYIDKNQFNDVLAFSFYYQF